MHLQGLLPGTTYHYRVVAVNALGETHIEGPDQTFTTQAAGAAFTLPDGRQWEMVTPPDKHGAGSDCASATNRAPTSRPPQDGSAITYGGDLAVRRQSRG